MQRLYNGDILLQIMVQHAQINCHSKFSMYVIKNIYYIIIIIVCIILE